jgi:hypothetical protein
MPMQSLFDLADAAIYVLPMLTAATLVGFLGFALVR